jgi:hypothetical protein
MNLKTWASVASLDRGIRAHSDISIDISLIFGSGLNDPNITRDQSLQYPSTQYKNHCYLQPLSRELLFEFNACLTILSPHFALGGTHPRNQFSGQAFYDTRDM